MVVFTKPSKAIGVLGGMGPEATAQFYKELIRECQTRYGAKYDSDFPEIIIYSLPLPDVVEGVSNRPKVLLSLKFGLRKLEKAGADFIVSPCNTIDIFYNETKEAVRIPFYSIVQETAKKVDSKKFKIVGIVGTEALLKSGLYDNILGECGIKLVKPDRNDRKILTRVILRILKGKKLVTDKAELVRMIKRLQVRGAEGIILGCTELPLIIQQEDANVMLFDTIKILAESAVMLSFGRSGVAAARKSVALEGRVQVPATALKSAASAKIHNHRC